MSQNQPLSIDWKEFNTKLPALSDAMMESAKKGLAKAADLLNWYADNVEPTTPLKAGDLKGSYKKGEIKVGVNDFSIEAVKDLVYARRLHEVQMQNYTTPGSGAKFLSDKLTRFHKELIQVVVLSMKTDTGSV